MTVFDDARARLPEDVALSCDEAKAAYEVYWAERAAGRAKGWEYEKANAPHRAMVKALQRVGLGTPESRALPMASLTSEQRDVIVVLSEDEFPIDGVTPMQGGARRRRRALGIDPPGVLDELVDGQPRWQLPDRQRALPDDRRVEAVIEGCLGQYPATETVQAAFDRVSEHAQHAGDYAARTLPTLGRESSYQLYWASAALFTALARSGTKVPEGCDWLFPIASHMQEPIPIPRVLEHAAALPPERRERALVDAMWRSDGRSSDVLTAVAAVLEAMPMPALLDEALRYASEKKKETKDVCTRQDLVALEKKLAATKKGQAEKKTTKRIVLKVESVLRPTSVEQLDAVRAEQLRIAGDLWEGIERPAARRLGKDESDESSFAGLCEWRVLSHGKRRIDAWLYAGDSGTYFEGGTLERIAERIQRSVAVLREGDATTGLDRALELASSTAAGEPKKAPTERSRTTKKA